MSEAIKCHLCERHADKSNWLEGPWKHELDHVVFEHAGVPCILHRGGGGNWCGYAAVPPGHPYHGLHYDTVYEKECELGVPDDLRVNVHGGLTYAEACGGHICHVPKPGEPDNVWWFGFDFGHAYDVSPWISHRGAEAEGFEFFKMANALNTAFNESRMKGRGEHYWTQEEAAQETMRLAETLAAIGSRFLLDKAARDAASTTSAGG
jgi:hypothetical protein